MTTMTQTVSKTRAMTKEGVSLKVSKPAHCLRDKWSWYYHLPDDSNWDISSYVLITSGIEEPEHLITINETVTDVIVKNAMLFVMKQGIKPIWEDEKNRHGGYLSFKVINKFVFPVWKSMVYAVCGQTFFSRLEDNATINGISISPKKTFCIIKVWLCNSSCKDSPIMPINHLGTGPEELKYTAFEDQISGDAKQLNHDSKHANNNDYKK